MKRAIREATPTDCDPIGAFHVAAWRETYAGLLRDRVPDGLPLRGRARMRRRWFGTRDPDRLLLVAEGADGLAGFTACRRLPLGEDTGTDAEVTALQVLRRAQRQGLGSAFLARLFDFMAVRRMASTGLWAFRENEGAPLLPPARGRRGRRADGGGRRRVPRRDGLHVAAGATFRTR